MNKRIAKEIVWKYPAHLEELKHEWACQHEKDKKREIESLIIDYYEKLDKARKYLNLQIKDD